MVEEFEKPRKNGSESQCGYRVTANPEVRKQLDKITVQGGKARIQKRVNQAADGHLGDCRPLGDGVSEMILSMKPGLRVYFMMLGHQILHILRVGCKDSQARDAHFCRDLARQCKDSLMKLVDASIPSASLFN